MVRQVARWFRGTITTALLVLLAACTIGPPPRGSVPQPAPVYGPESAPPPPQSVPPGSSPASSAVDSLLNQARQQAAAGRYDAAISTAERAVRIAPQNPDGYEQLATLYAAHNDCAHAVQFAGKALSLSTDAGQRQRLQALRSNCNAGYR